MEWFRNYGLSVYSKKPVEVTRLRVGGGAIEVVRFRWAGTTVLGLYKSPANEWKLGQLLDLLEPLLPVGGVDEEKVIIVGDFNVNMRKRDLIDTRRLIERMEAQKFTHHDVGCTTDFLTQIDQIWSNFKLSEPTQSLDSYFSDHKPLLISLPYTPDFSQEL